jgi:tetratricopeptide (TPR) repeat protein
MVIASFALAFATNGSLAQSAPWEAAPQQQLPSGSPFLLQAPETGAALAQQSAVSPFTLSITQPGAAQATAPAASAANKVDETALRYYAQNGEIGRVSAEIKRLKSLHPDWQPPENIYDQNRVEVNEQPLWDLFATGRTQELYAKIREYIKLYPGYEPSDELRRQIINAEARKTLIQASELGNHQEVIQTAVKNTDLLTCQEIDMIWRTAKALNETGQELKALEAYRYILTNCANEDERKATVQKAAEILPRSAVEQLVSLGRTGLDGRSEFNEIYLDLLRGEVGEGATDPTMMVEKSDLDALANSAAKLQNPNDAELLGWYYYSREEFKTATKWFQAAYKLRPTPKAIEGMVVSMKEEGDYEEAEELAYKNRRKDPLILKAYLEVVSIQLLEGYGTEMDFKRLSRFANVVQDAQSPIAAQVFGWHFFNMMELNEAEIWFSKSMEFQPNEAAAVGLIVVAQRKKQKTRERQLIAQWSNKFPAIKMLGNTQLASASATRSSSSGGSRSSASSYLRSAEQEISTGDYASALPFLERNAMSGQESRKAKLLRAWALYHTGRSKEAHKLFAEADKSRSTTETRQGKWFSEKKMYRYN